MHNCQRIISKLICQTHFQTHWKSNPKPRLGTRMGEVIDRMCTILKAKQVTLEENVMTINKSMNTRTPKVTHLRYSILRSSWTIFSGENKTRFELCRGWFPRCLAAPSQPKLQWKLITTRTLQDSSSFYNHAQGWSNHSCTFKVLKQNLLTELQSSESHESRFAPPSSSQGWSSCAV